MSIPKHSQEINENRQAVAPYNFVPLPDSVRLLKKELPSHDTYHEKLLTGKFTCTLTNATPIYVRAAQTTEEYQKEQPSPEPFYYEQDKKYLIPGSSIRGMLRTLVEVVSQARIAPVTEKRIFYRSVERSSMGEDYRDKVKDNIRAGFFHRDNTGAWIKPTVAVRIERNEISSGSLYQNEDQTSASPTHVPKNSIQHKPVFVRLNENSKNNPARFFDAKEFSFTQAKSNELDEAVLVITGDMQGKRKEFAFLRKDSAEKIPLKDELITEFEDRDQITPYQEFAFPKEDGRRADGYLKDGEPIFYLVGENENDVIGFGRAYMFRIAYAASPKEMLPNELTDNIEKYDLAEAIFGYVPQDKEGKSAIAGRVSVSDAFMQGDAKEALLPETYLKILSSPKPSAFQQYLTQKYPNEATSLFHYNTSTKLTTLRGHKFYWHKGAINESDYKADEKTVQEFKKQLSPPVKPIKEGQTFRFEINFENLRPEELGALLWVLDKAKDDDYRLKLGMGKPYGLGSIKIEYKLEFDDRRNRYKELFSGPKWATSSFEDENKAKDARASYSFWLTKEFDASFESIDVQERIQELLMMLSWKGVLPKEKTRYQELDEFKNRPVLPSPQKVFGEWLKQATPKTYVPADVSPDELKPGDAILASVYYKDKGDVYLECEHHGEEDLCVVRKKDRKTNDYSLDMEGLEVLLRVLKIFDTDGTWLIECETIKQ